MSQVPCWGQGRSPVESSYSLLPGTWGGLQRYCKQGALLLHLLFLLLPHLIENQLVGGGDRSLQQSFEVCSEHLEH